MKKILLADDSITIQKVVSITFASEDYDLVIVGDGDTAIAKTKESRPDLIMADVAMPGKDGYEVCETIKNDPALSSIPVLLLAGTFEPLSEEAARKAGADDHIVKPFESEVLIQKVKTLLEGAAARAGAEMAVPEPAEPAEAELPEPAEPIEPEPIEPEPVLEEPVLEEPVLEEPVQTKPVQEEPVQAEPVLEEPTQAEPKETPAPVTSDIWEAGDFLTPSEGAGETTGVADFGFPEETPKGETPGGEAMEKPTKEEPRPKGEDFIDLILAEEAATETREEVSPAPPAPPTPPTPTTPTEEPITAPSAPEPSAPEAPVETGGEVEGIKDLGALSREKVEEIVSKVTRDIIEEIAWEVVPELAEEIIRAEILGKIKDSLAGKK
jgi:CheY-like chemotaxis protein